MTTERVTVRVLLLFGDQAEIVVQALEGRRGYRKAADGSGSTR
ncbi:hypothetical protein [Streptomyces sp. NPDC002520]